MTLKERIAVKERILLDGGMGTELMKYPEYTGKNPSLINTTHPEIVTAVHKSYVDAGAELIIANTFDVNPKKYENYAEIISAAVNNARAAGAPYVGLDIGPIGELLYPMGLLKTEDAYEYFRAVALEGVKNEVEFFIIETMTDENEAREAIRAVRDVSPLPVILSAAFNKRGRMLTTGCRPDAFAKIAEEYGADAVGANCSFGPDLMLPVIEGYTTATTLPVMAKPNAGLPAVVDGKTVYSIGAEDFACHMKKLREAGASLTGGCCGTTPEYIAAIKNI